MLQHVQQDRTRHGPGDSSMISAVGSCVQIRTRPCYYQLEHLWKMLMMRWIMATPILRHIQHDGHTLTTTDGEQVIAETIDVGHCQKHRKLQTWHRQAQYRSQLLQQPLPHKCRLHAPTAQMRLYTALRACTATPTAHQPICMPNLMHTFTVRWRCKHHMQCGGPATTASYV